MRGMRLLLEHQCATNCLPVGCVICACMRAGTLTGFPFIQPSPLRPSAVLPQHLQEAMDARAANHAETGTSDDLMQELRQGAADDAKFWKPSVIECPQAGCEDLMPADPTGTLARVLEQRRKILAKEVSGSMMQINSYLCDALDYELRCLPAAISEGWPSSLNPVLLSKRIELFRPHLQEIADAPSDAFIWRLLDADNGGMRIKALHSTYTRKPSCPSLIQVFESIRVG